MNYNNEDIQEVWKEVKGYEGLYSVSNLGKVKSHLSKKQGKLMKLGISTTGYYMVNLYKDKKMKRTRVHRMVANAFIQPIEGKEIVNHKDGNPLNNNVNNLEWCTYKENSNHAVEIGLQESFYIDRFLLYDLYYNQNKSSKQIGDQLNCSSSTILKKLKKYGFKTKTAYEQHTKYYLDENLILIDFKKGMRNKDIAHKYNCNSGIISTMKWNFKKKGLLPVRVE